MAAPRSEHAHASALPAAATPTPRLPHPRQQDGGKIDVLSSANAPSTVALRRAPGRWGCAVRSLLLRSIVYHQYYTFHHMKQKMPKMYTKKIEKKCTQKIFNINHIKKRKKLHPKNAKMHT
jgi:hypothetical protein